MEKNLTTAKERASVYKEKGTTEKFCHSDAARFFFFHFLLKDRKKPVIKCFFLKWNFVCYRRNENLFVPFEIV